jgi:hypothetical protein
MRNDLEPPRMADFVALRARDVLQAHSFECKHPVALAPLSVSGDDLSFWWRSEVPPVSSLFAFSFRASSKHPFILWKNNAACAPSRVSVTGVTTQSNTYQGNNYKWRIATSMRGSSVSRIMKPKRFASARIATFSGRMLATIFRRLSLRAISISRRKSSVPKPRC